MNKKLRVRITNAISSTFNSCKPKHNGGSTTNPAQVFYLSPSNPKIHDIEFPTPPPPPRSSPSRRGVSVLVSTTGCKSCAPAHSPRWEEDTDDLSRARSTPGYLWRKEEKWLHVTSVATADGFQMFQRRPKIDCPNDVVVDHDDDDDDDDQFDHVLSSNVLKLASRRKREIEMRRRAQIRGRKSKSKSRNSTSSVASTGTWFSSEGDNEREEEELYYNEDEGDDTDTLLSSRSFSGDSSRTKTRTVYSGCATAMLSKLCGGDEGKVKESFAVVKRSEDPRGDFRRSMAEMVVEKGIYEAAELEHLLHCFLSLNHKQHHGAIVSAFTDIWEALFPLNSPRF